MSQEETILFERIQRDGAVWAEITLNRPDKGNALTMEMLERLGTLADQLRALINAHIEVLAQKDRDLDRVR